MLPEENNPGALHDEGEEEGVVDEGQAGQGPVEDVADLLGQHDRNGDAIGNDAGQCDRDLWERKK